MQIKNIPVINLLRILKKQKILLQQIKNNNEYLTAELKNIEIVRLEKNIKETENKIRELW